MAELDKLVIEISADDAKFIQSLATIRNGLQDFGATGTASAEQVAKALKAVEKAVLSTNDAAKKQELVALYNKLNKELVRTKKEFKELTKIIDEGGGGDNNLPRLNKNLKDVDEQARRSRIAIYGLNQVVRDAPFGFIAISNNLPVLFDQLGQLRQETGSATKAFTSFGRGLIGPAGISIALSAVTSLVTTAVQKYGSLGEAFDALIGKAGVLTDDQKKFAESLASEVAEISVLIGAYPELATSRENQEGILKKLNNLQPEYFKSLKTEKTTIDDLKKSYDDYLKSLVARIFIEQQTKQIEEIAKSYATELSRLLEKEKAVRAEQQKRISSTKNQVAQQQQLADINNRLIKQGDIITSVEILVKEPPKTFDQLIKEQTGRFKDSVKELLDVQKDFFKAIDFTGVFTDTKSESKKATEEEKNRRDEIEKTIAAYEFELEQLQEVLKGTSKITVEYGKIRSEIIKVQAEIKKLKNPELTLKIEDKLKADLDKIESELRDSQIEAGRVRFTPKFDFDEEARKDLEKILKDKIKIKGTELPLNIPPELLEAFKQYNLELALAKQRTEELRPIVDALAGVFGNALTGFIDNFIDGFENGQIAIEDFQESLKELGKTILKELAKLAILTTIKVLSEKIAPGTGDITAGFAKKLLGAAAPANIGTGGLPVGPGGLAIRGNVTFVQRGQDLVGVLARSNARINRVG
jgi:hypothetical protein